MRFCPSQKIVYLTKDEATRRARYWKSIFKKKQRAYHCALCDCWHTTTAKDKHTLEPVYAKAH
jgi:hypothetical protein